MGVTVMKGEQDAAALIRREPLQALGHRPASAAQVRERLRVRLVAGELRPLVGDLHLLRTDLEAAQQVQRPVAHDADHPGDAAALGPGVAARAVPDLDEALLQDLLGEGLLAQDAQTDAEQARRGLPVELLEGALVALRATLEQGDFARTKLTCPIPLPNSTIEQFGLTGAVAINNTLACVGRCELLGYLRFKFL